MRTKISKAGWFLAALLLAGGFALAQRVGAGRGLVINGYAGVAPVIEVNGATYVEVEALARLANASLSFSGNQIVLTLPDCTGGSAPASPEPPVASGFSKDFLRAGIEEMTIIREWRSALQGVVENNAPVTAEWMASYRGQAVTSLRLAQVAVITDSDRSAFQLLSTEFNNMDKLSSQVVASRKAMNFLDPDSLKNDPLNLQIIACGRSLAAMAASGTFQDDGTCR